LSFVVLEICFTDASSHLKFIIYLMILVVSLFSCMNDYLCRAFLRIDWLCSESYFHMIGIVLAVFVNEVIQSVMSFSFGLAEIYWSLAGGTTHS